MSFNNVRKEYRPNILSADETEGADVFVGDCDDCNEQGVIIEKHICDENYDLLSTDVIVTVKLKVDSDDRQEIESMLQGMGYKFESINHHLNIMEQEVTNWQIDP